MLRMSAVVMHTSFGLAFLTEFTSFRKSPNARSVKRCRNLGAKKTLGKLNLIYLRGGVFLHSGLEVRTSGIRGAEELAPQISTTPGTRYVSSRSMMLHSRPRSTSKVPRALEGRRLSRRAGFMFFLHCRPRPCGGHTTLVRDGAEHARQRARDSPVQTPGSFSLVSVFCTKPRNVSENLVPAPLLRLIAMTRSQQRDPSSRLGTRGCEFALWIVRFSLFHNTFT